MAELVIALLVVVLVISGLTQFIQLSNEKESIMGRLRGEAGLAAMGGSHSASAPEYIVSWKVGPDGMRHTGDDSRTAGSFNRSLGTEILDRSVADDSAWPYISGTANSDLYNLRTSPSSSSSLGFIRRSEKKKIELMPAVRDLFKNRDSITVGDEIWMPVLEVR